MGGERVGQGNLIGSVSSIETSGNHSYLGRGHSIQQGEQLVLQPCDSLWSTWGRDLWLLEASDLDLQGRAKLC